MTIGWKNRLVTVLPRGLSMALRARYLLARDADRDIRIVRSLAGQGGFVDIGANVGNWSVVAARYFSHVIAFEPLPELARFIRTTSDRRITIHDVALSDVAGQSQIMVPVVGNRSLSTRASLRKSPPTGDETVETLIVTTARLDDYALRDIRCIKIDVEGHEGAVIDGAIETIARERPLIVCEIENRHNDGRTDALISRIESLGYDSWYLDRGTPHRMANKSLSELEVRLDRLPNNFLFCPVEKTLPAGHGG